MITVRSGDAPDATGSDGEMVKEFLEKYNLQFWSPTYLEEEDRRSHGVYQVFDRESGFRRIFGYDIWESYVRPNPTTLRRWVKYPPHVPSAPWGRPGYVVGRGVRRFRRDARE